MRASVVAAFRQIDILNGLEDPQIEQLSAFSQVRNIRKGETVFLQHEPSPYCFGVITGEVIIQRIDRDRRYPPKVIGLFGPGALFGESALFEDQPRSASATASSDGQLLLIQGGKFREWLRDNAQAGGPLLMAILRQTLDHLQRTTRELSVVYGIDRLLGTQGELSERMREAVDFVRCSLDEVDRIALYKVDAAQQAFEPFAHIPEGDVLPVLLAGTDLISYAASAHRAVVLDDHRQRQALSVLGGLWAGCAAAAIVPLIDRTDANHPLEGILLVGNDTKKSAFSPHAMFALNAVAHQLAEGFIRHRRESDVLSRLEKGQTQAPS
jgi:CRP/FNR family transcriptional regulator, cyclic AMP receptor protein